MRALDLSDAQLMQAFRSLGHRIGPVVDSTRHLYRRKLCERLGINEDDNVDPSVFFGGVVPESSEHQFVRSQEFGSAPAFSATQADRTPAKSLWFIYGLAAVIVSTGYWYYLM